MLSDLNLWSYQSVALDLIYNGVNIEETRILDEVKKTYLGTAFQVFINEAAWKLKCEDFFPVQMRSQYLLIS